LSSSFYSFYAANFGFFFEHAWFTDTVNLTDDTFQNTVIIDLMNYTNSIELPFSTEVAPILGWYSPYILEHPEICAYLSRYEGNYYFNKFSSFLFLFFNNNTFLTIKLGFFLFVELIKILYIYIFIKIFFFSYLFNTSADTQNLDCDFTVGTLTTEAEKEIAAIEDLIPLFLALLFIFGGYFMSYGFVQVLSLINSFVFLFLLLPLFFLYIYVAPLCLLIDFGIFCFVYLRGSGPTSMLAAELLYDLINLFAFYIRVGIQLARILLMLIAGGSLQEFIYYFGIESKFLIFNENFFDELNNLEFNISTLTFFFFTKFPAYLFY
jgi:hypothetical protein